MGRNGQKRLDQLIDEVARGVRPLSSIKDPKLREAVRIALRIHADRPTTPDAYTKARMRARVMAGLDPRPRALRDNAWTILELLAKPAPYIARGVAVLAVMAVVGMSAIVASADTLPDDGFYPIKVATEQFRLAMADAPGDRASVELSIAAHRLSEAEKLAASGRTSDALIASALYTQHVATAAAEIAPQDADTDLGAQLASAFASQRERAQTLARALASDMKSARGAQVLALIASPTLAPGGTKIEQVAVTAATMAAQLANAADLAAAESADAALAATPAKNGDLTVAAPAGAAAVPSNPLNTPAGSPSGTAGATQPASTSAASPATSATPSTSAAATASVVGSSASSSPAVSPKSDTSATTTTTTNATTAGPAASTRTSAPTHDPRASEAAKTAREAAEKAREAADRLKQLLNEKSKNNKGSGR